MRHIESITYQVKCTGYSKDGVSFPTERTVDYIVGKQYMILVDKRVTLEKIVVEGIKKGFELCFSMGYILFVPDREGLEMIYKDDEPEN